ncbi:MULTISPECIES: hypothetical protein [Amycolatopsis]|uniref:Dihydrodiol dehydrogenase n=2 Tax=Amycolatopsis rubida TaxID=112413 RepID=A0A1I5FYF6_9PSEU|nr:MULTISPECIES: hypothetical protein [Amycolatopsis]OAP27727.1 hypothetical protein A4R44_01334 [Amycolatopsis sp. M39]SFO28251.1 hypothetical protein SAMN05421854_1011326 [Amycolatopsis rubida]
MSDSGRSGSDGMPIEDILAALEPDPDRVLVRNEFAVVGVTVRESGGGRSRLRIEDLRTRQAVELDALELESLAWARHDDLSPLLDPSRSRWAGTGE